jgi:hypothetical protein
MAAGYMEPVRPEPAQEAESVPVIPAGLVVGLVLGSVAGSVAVSASP